MQLEVVFHSDKQADHMYMPFESKFFLFELTFALHDTKLFHFLLLFTLTDHEVSL